MSILSLILAGGQGSGLGILTERQAKPAVPFGGKYRIIDFALSNVVNSSLNRVAVLAQYQPGSLQEYLGRGDAWGLGVGDRPALQIWLASNQRTGQEKYLGTADAIQQNRKYILEDGSDTVVILSGDHICKIDYNPVLLFHQDKQADLTVVVTKVAAQQAAQFGMLSMDDDQRITQFVEKPVQTEFVLGSLGIYVFNTNILLNVLEQDAVDPTSAHDFGMSIIPKLVKSGRRVYGFMYDGPWADVGTLQSLFDANLALLQEKPILDLFDPEWTIHTRQAGGPPAMISRSGRVTNSLVSDGCMIDGEVIHCVLGPNVRVEWGAALQDCVVLKDTVIHTGKLYSSCILDHDTEVFKLHHD